MEKWGKGPQNLKGLFMGYVAKYCLKSAFHTVLLGLPVHLTLFMCMKCDPCVLAVITEKKPGYTLQSSSMSTIQGSNIRTNGGI